MATNTNNIEMSAERPEQDLRVLEADQKEVTPTIDAQAGVQKIEAVTLAWSKKSLYVALALYVFLRPTINVYGFGLYFYSSRIWLLTLVNGMKSTILLSLTPYITSSWQSHSLLTVINIVANAITAAVYIPMAKVLDVWGRAEGFLIMMVFYSVGFSGLSYTWNVLAADVTNLRNRGIAFAFTSSPAIITAFAGFRAAQAFVTNVTWRWGVGCWAIVLPAVALPVFGLLKYNHTKAKRTGIVVADGERPNVTAKAVFWFLAIDVDCEYLLSLYLEMVRR